MLDCVLVVLDFLRLALPPGVSLQEFHAPPAVQRVDESPAALLLVSLPELV